MRVVLLEGELLDAAVAKAMGYVSGITRRSKSPAWISPEGWLLKSDFRPSSEWQLGGQIIEREHITLVSPGVGSVPGEWQATIVRVLKSDSLDIGERGGVYRAQSPLVAAMRAYVAFSFGQEVTL